MTGLRFLPAVMGFVLAAPLASAQTLTVANPSNTPAPAAKAATADTSVSWIELSSKQGELRGKLPELVKAEMAKAKASGKTPFIEVGATWCGPCQALEASLHNKDMVDAFAGAYIIHLDVNEWDTQDEMGPLGIDGGVMPFIAALNTKGHVVSQLKGTIAAPDIKKFIQDHLWTSSMLATKHVAKN